MTISQISALLEESHRSFCRYLDSLSQEQFEARKEGKWSAGQQLDHILLAVQPVRLAFSLPKFVLRLVWGKANRASRSYEELVTKYLQKLHQGGRASGRFLPKEIAFEQSKKLQNALQKEIAQLNQLLLKWNEEDLDTYVLPHPLLGKLTLREMLYFTNYHVKHHRNTIENALQ